MGKEGKSSDATFFRRLIVFARRNEPGSRGAWCWVRNRLMVGLLVAFPLAVTVFFARIVFRFLDRWFRPISEHFFGFPILGGGALIAVIGLLFLGILATNVFGGRLLGFFETTISRLPLFSPIYKGARQITEAIQVGGSTDFRRVVLIEFPHPGIRSVGFVTREFQRPTAFSEQPSALVFVPTTPNPTSGFLVSAKQKDMINLDITVEQGVKFVISGGLITPDQLLMIPGAVPHQLDAGETDVASPVRDGDQDSKPDDTSELGTRPS